MENLRYYTELHWMDRWGDWRSESVAVMTAHYEVPVLLCVGYLAIIFGLQRAMRHRKPFDLSGPLFWWNVFLALFSIFGALAVVPPIVGAVLTVGASFDMCHFGTEADNPFVLLFCLSKIPELIDTLFIVLRKRPLIFLHYYHHALTLLYAWTAWAIQSPNGGWFAAMNLIVHSLMYSYYAACARGVRFSQTIRQSITSLQILQMVAGVSIVVHNMVVCNANPIHNMVGLGMYISYFILFTKLFIDSYCTKPSSPSARNRAKKIAKGEDDELAQQPPQRPKSE